MKKILFSRALALVVAIATIIVICSGFAFAVTDVYFVVIDVSGELSGSKARFTATDVSEKDTALNLDIDAVNLISTLNVGNYWLSVNSPSGYSLSSTEITISSGTEYVPLFLFSGSSRKACLALYAVVNTVAELSILGDSDVRIAKNGNAVSTAGKISGNRLTLSAGELAVITNLSANTFTLNGSSVSASTGGTFIALTDSGSSDDSSGGETDSLLSGRDILAIALDNAKDFENREDDYTSESWIIFESAYAFAKNISGNNSATEQQIINAANNLFDALDGLEQIYVAPNGTTPLVILDKAEFGLEPTKNVTIIGETVVFEITSADAAYLANAVIEFSYSDTLEFEYAGGKAGFTVLLVNSSPGKGIITVINNNFSASNSNSFSSTEPDTVIARLRFRATDTGDSSISLSKANTSAVDSEGLGTDVTANISGASVDFTITEGESAPDLPLDFNGDFNVTLADIATVQTYYRCSASANPTMWQKAKYADYDNDEVITVADYLLILAEYNDWLS